MRWQGREKSENVEDRRGMPVKGLAAGGGLATLVIVLIVMFLGGDPKAVLQQAAQQQQAGQAQPAPRSAEEEQLAQFVSVVLKDTEDVWNKLFAEEVNQRYSLPKLVLFSGGVESACGNATAAAGPFYCPADEKVYIDLAFCEEMRTKFKAPGDFAIAYVLAHEVGHHVQNQLGFTERVHGQRRSLPEAEYNKLSVRLELQADYLAGVWAHHAQKMKNILEQGDVEEALGAAAAVGDDTLQKKSSGYVVPDAFTHGTSEQRARWFRAGLKTGNLGGMKDLFDMPYGQL